MGLSKKYFSKITFFILKNIEGEMCNIQTAFGASLAIEVLLLPWAVEDKYGLLSIWRAGNNKHQAFDNSTALLWGPPIINMKLINFSFSVFGLNRLREVYWEDSKWLWTSKLNYGLTKPKLGFVRLALLWEATIKKQLTGVWRAISCSTTVDTSVARHDIPLF